MDYKKYLTLPVPPLEVYLALTKAQSIQLWTGAEVEFEEKPNTDFSLWDGDIIGKNIAFEYGKKIEQQWYFGEENEPAIATIKLHFKPPGTSLEFRLTNIPPDDFKNFTADLEAYYFGGLTDFFEEE